MAARDHEPRQRLTAAPSLADFCARPVGRYVAGSSYLLWVASPTLVGTAYFARPTEQEWTALVAASDVARHPTLQPPYDAVIDAAGLDDLSVDAFEALVSHLDFAKGYMPLIRRVAVVRPPGLVGATLTGLFYDHLGPRFAAALFQERDEAFAWLGRTDTTRVAREVAGILEAARGTPALVRRLRAHLTTAPGRPDLPRAARATGVAARSLQRHLREAGTSFRAEVDRARIALAERMLVGGDAKIEAVARRSGFTSASHLSRTFRRATGETPAEFRKRRRVLPD